MTGHSHPCHSCPTRGAQVQPWRREGSGRMDRTERALGTGGAGLRGAAEARGRGPPLLTAKKGRGPRRDGGVCSGV